MLVRSTSEIGDANAKNSAAYLCLAYSFTQKTGQFLYVDGYPHNCKSDRWIFEAMECLTRC